MSRGESLTPLAKVRGLGASGHGGEHWLEERFSSVALVVLSLWLLFSLLMLPALDYGTVAVWLHGVWGAVPMALFVIAAFRHGVEGLKVAVDDYVHDEGNRIAVHYLLSMAGTLGTALALFGLAKIAFGAAA